MELERHDSARGCHVEAQIGDSVVVMEAGAFPPEEMRTCASVYVYVEDVDAAFARALERGATSLREPADQDYGERNAGVRDSFGNVWWIATLLA